MTLLHLDSIKKHFGAQEVLRGASVRLDPGEKVGLVGRNGGGKTTILRLIEGLELPDWGSVTLRKGARLGHVPQRPQFEPGRTVRAEVESGMEETRALLRELEACDHLLGEVHGEELARALKEHDRLTHEVEARGGWEGERAIETVLSGIGLGPEFWEREAATLSGGEKSRVALARVLISGSDLLLLDEPTNHLDLPGIEWLESWLREQKCAVLIVSHDRRLLDNAVSTIYELERGELVRYSGNYTAYLALKDERFKSELRAWEQQEDYIRKEETFIKKHMGSQRTAEAKGREKKLGNLVRLRRPFNDVRRPSIRAPKPERGGESVLETRDLAGGYDGKPLFSGADLRIARGERIGIVGRNGAGKTTLLKLLADRMAPMKGEVTYGHRAQCGYYDQEMADLRSDSTPYLELRQDHPQWTDQQIRDHLARFLFRGNDIDALVASLSGGERARLALARLLSRDPTWLAMDEPTNHLDLAARTALEEMLGEYQGALVFVSHDREFLDGLCNQILDVDGGKVTRTVGNYSQWRAQKLAKLSAASENVRVIQKVAAQKQAAKVSAAKQAKSSTNPRAAATNSTAMTNEAAKKPLGGKVGGKVRNPYLFEKLEQRIMELEQELARLQLSTTTEEVYRNGAKLRDVQMRMAEIERDLTQANEEWERWIG